MFGDHSCCGKTQLSGCTECYLNRTDDDLQNEHWSKVLHSTGELKQRSTCLFVAVHIHICMVLCFAAVAPLQHPCQEMHKDTGFCF